MEEKEHYKKTEEYIIKFVNGEERYRTSPTFNIAIQMLVRGVDPYQVIDQLCQNVDDLNEAFKQYILRDPKPKHSGRF